MAVGVDIKRYRSIGLPSMTGMVCHPQEQKALEGLTNKEQGFYTLWAAKEALLKAHGSGLINHLNCSTCLLDRMDG